MIIFTLAHETRVRAGKIEEIFLHQRLGSLGGCYFVEPFFLVHEFVPLMSHHVNFDPFVSIPHLDAWLCYNRFHLYPTIVTIDEVISHFAGLVYTPPFILELCIVIRSLRRVNDSF